MLREMDVIKDVGQRNTLTTLLFNVIINNTINDMKDIRSLILIQYAMDDTSSMLDD